MSLIKALEEKVAENDSNAVKVFEILCKYAKDSIEIDENTLVETVLDYYSRQYNETRDKEATSTKELREELTKQVSDRVDKQVLSEVLKDATLAEMLNELILNKVHPAEIIGIITGARAEDSSLVVYFDNRYYNILKRNCKFTEPKERPSVKELLKYLAYRLIETEVNTELTEHARQLQEKLPQENKDVTEKALRNEETLKTLIDLYNAGLCPELLLQELCAEYTLILLDNNSITTPVTSGAKTDKKLIFYPETTEIPAQTLGVTAHIQELAQQTINNNFSGMAHSTNYRPDPPMANNYTPYSTMYHTAEQIGQPEVCRRCGTYHVGNCVRRNTYDTNEFTGASYTQNSSLSKIRPFSIKDTINTIPEFSGSQEEVENFVIGCGRAKGMIPPENEIEVAPLILLRLKGEAAKAAIGHNFRSIQEVIDFVEFAFGNPQTSHELGGDLAKVRQGEKEKVVLFANKIKELGRKIKKAAKLEGRPLEDSTLDRDMLRFFLKGMRTEIRTRLMPYATFADTLNEAIVVERESCSYDEAKAVKTEQIKVVSTHTTPNNNYCFLCLRQDHTTLLCPELPKFVEGRKQQANEKANRGQLQCSHCSKVGHVKETCWSVPGNPNKPEWLTRRQQMVCHNCKKKGHTSRFCRSRPAEVERASENSQGNGSSHPTGASREAPNILNTPSI